MLHRRLIWIFSAAFLFIFSSPLQADNSLGFTVEDAVRRIELRRGHWISLKAEVELQFVTSEGKRAVCQGSLLYQRLEEAIFLNCFNSQGKTLFIFKTTDRDFDLYLPRRKSFYHGNIFVLEDSPSIESHLRPFDLYRAFKPLLVPAAETELVQIAQGIIKLTVRKNGKISRELEVTNQGDIVSETYYGPDEKISLEIKRDNFVKIIPAPSSGTPEPAFPRQITLSSPRSHSLSAGMTQTFFVFKKIDFTAELSDQDFILSVPEDTREIVLEDNF